MYLFRYFHIFLTTIFPSISPFFIDCYTSTNIARRLIQTTSCDCYNAGATEYHHTFGIRVAVLIPVATMWLDTSHIYSKQEQLPSHSMGKSFGSKGTDNLLLNLEFRPQVGPSKGRRSSKGQPPKDIACPKRARHQERNCVAANKCHLKKQQEQLKFQRALSEATLKWNNF